MEAKIGLVVHREANPQLAPLVLASLALLGIAVNPVGLAAAAPACVPGWTLIAEYDNSFAWQGSPSTEYQPHSGTWVTWTGSVRLIENLDANCYVTGVVVEFTGPSAGGTLTLNGYKIGASYSIQYPAPVDRWTDVPTNAWGDAVFWNPDGYYLVFYSHIHPNINARGAEEYFIGTLELAESVVPGTPTFAAVTNVTASFSLPLELLGTTVYAQALVYPDFCRCSVTPILIPGVAAPPA